MVGYDILPPTTAIVGYDILPPTTAIVGYDILPPTTAIVGYDILPPATVIVGYTQVSDGAQVAVTLQQTTQIISDVSFTMSTLLTLSQLKPKSFESRRNSVFTLSGRASFIRACLDAMLLSQSY